MIGRAQVVAWLHNAQRVLADNKGYLTDLDRAIGDADHGINMARGFQKLAEQLSASDDRDIGAILRASAMALLANVGGAAGALYGTLFLEGAAALEGKGELSLADLHLFWAKGIEAVKKRGKAERGDKTMIDALAPAVDSLAVAIDRGQDAARALEEAASAAEAGMKATVPLVARKGRASYLGERSRDHQDPGATSAYLLLRALADAVAADAGDQPS